MFGSVVVDVAIGMAFVYLLMSLIASVVQEILAAFLQLRSANLERGMRSLFSGDSIWGQDLVDAIYNHGLVRGLYADPQRDLVESARNTFEAAQKGLEAATGAAQRAGITPDLARKMVDDAESAATRAKAEVDRLTKVTEKSLWARAVTVLRNLMQKLIGIVPEKGINGVSSQVLLPSYIPSRTFALALIDILNNNKVSGNDAMGAIKNSLAEHHWIYKANKAGEALLSLAVDAKGDLDAFQKNVENWYNDSMDRASGWYKKYTQRILLYIGIVLAIVFNVSSIRVARTLWYDRDSRQAMVNAADQYVKTHPDPPVQPKDIGTKTDTNQPAPATQPLATPAAGVTAPVGDAAGGTAAPGTQTGAATPQGSNAGSSDDANKNGTAAIDPHSKADDLKKKLTESASAFTAVTDSALLPVGWKRTPTNYLTSGWNYLKSYDGQVTWRQGLNDRLWRCLVVLLGWTMTAMAISLGAPFWFDTLNRFMVVRSTVKPQEKSQPEESKD